MRAGRGEVIAAYTLLIVFTLVAVVPLLGVLATALTPPAGQGSAAGPSAGAFAEAWQRGRFAGYLGSSVVVTTAVVVLSGVLSILAGYAFARMRFPLSTPLFVSLLAGLMLPAEAFVLPLYFTLREAGLTDTYAAMVLPQTAQSLAFGILWMRTAFARLPQDVLDAARLDGARDLRVLWQVAVPASRPAVVTLCLLTGMWTWNEFLIPLIMVTRESLRTAPLGLAFFEGQYSTDYALLAAGGVIVALPVVLLYLFLQRHIVAGVVGAARR